MLELARLRLRLVLYRIVGIETEVGDAAQHRSPSVAPIRDVERLGPVDIGQCRDKVVGVEGCIFIIIDKEERSLATEDTWG